MCSSDLQIITLNAKDFPKHILREEGVDRRDPDALLMQAFEAAPEAIAQVADAIKSRAEHLSEAAWQTRAFFKKARLPKLAKALAAAEG